VVIYGNLLVIYHG